MNDNKRLEEANKEVEKSKSILTNNLNDKEGDEKEKKETDEEGSGIFTADGKELPKIDGGYDIINPGGNLSDDEFVSV